MKKHDFEFSDNKFALKLFLICLIVFFALLFTTISFGFNFLVTITVSFGIPVVVFWLNKKKISKKGFAVIHHNSVDFNLNGIEKSIRFNDIKNYQVQIYNGSTLNIKLKTGEKTNIVSNWNFCDTHEFDVFCREFEAEIEKFKTENNSELVRKKSFFEQAWIFPFLVIITAVLIIMVLMAIFRGLKLKPSIFISIGPLITLWAGYFSAKNKSKT